MNRLWVRTKGKNDMGSLEICMAYPVFYKDFPQISRVAQIRRRNLPHIRESAKRDGGWA